ncbi:MAG: ATP-dependent 6-phosphofructokinase [Rickettsiales bacterium]|jgi:6-phosphofructokinase 1|nr:ATP-dependent 6-phosphofructokinase [Rickettsiales bacterium]
MKNVKKIGVFTSGGDCSGLNATINSVVRAANEKDIEVYGIYEGTDGLFYPNLKYIKLKLSDLANNFSSMRTGGTILKSKNRDNKSSDADFEKNKAAFERGIKELGLDSLIVIGGDGSAEITSRLIEGTDTNVICVPKTIDNDTPMTEYSIGFDTARNVTMEAMDRLQTTAFSHNRTMILEVMGRDAGHLALHTAIAGEACVCIIPEISYNIDNVCKKLDEIKNNGISYALVVVAEGAKTENGENLVIEKCGVECYTGFANYISQKLGDRGYLNRTVILGHVQRGGTPTAYDRIVASEFGVYAIDILLQGKNNRIVIIKDGRITDVDLFEAVAVGNRPVSKDDILVKTARALGMYVGEI